MITTTEELVDKCIEVILIDINSRSGLGSSWRMISPEVKEEIIARWKFDVKKVLVDAKVELPKAPVASSSTISGGTK